MSRYSEWRESCSIVLGCQEGMNRESHRETQRCSKRNDARLRRCVWFPARLAGRDWLILKGGTECARVGLWKPNVWGLPQTSGCGALMGGVPGGEHERAKDNVRVSKGGNE